MEEGGSHTVLFSYKGSKGPSYPRRTDSVGRPSETWKEGGRITRAETATRQVVVISSRSLDQCVVDEIHRCPSETTHFPKRSLSEQNFVGDEAHR